MRSKTKSSKVQTVQRRIKCIFNTRTVVEQGVPSGQRYDFQPGETRRITKTGDGNTVKAEDVQFLLSRERRTGGGCCGATPAVIRFFEEV